MVAPHDASLPPSLGPAERRGEVLTLNRGRTLHKQGKGCRRFYILLEVRMHDGGDCNYCGSSLDLAGVTRDPRAAVDNT